MYYADLNPEYPSRGAKRYAIFFRNPESKVSVRVRLWGSFSSRNGAEIRARRLNESQKIVEVPVSSP